MDYYLKISTPIKFITSKENVNIRLGDIAILYFNSTLVWQHIIRIVVQRIHILKC